jgi:hypothetical protein
MQGYSALVFNLPQWFHILRYVFDGAVDSPSQRGLAKDFETFEADYTGKGNTKTRLLLLIDKVQQITPIIYLVCEFLFFLDERINCRLFAKYEIEKVDAGFLELKI